MTPFVKKILFSALLFEILLFCMLYFFGPNGRHVVVDLLGQKVLLHLEIKKLQENIIDLQKKINLAETDFAKEAIARERLLMKKDNEIIYFRK